MVGTATNLVGVVLVLAIVVPEAHWANVLSPALRQGAEPAARAGIRATGRRTYDVLEAPHGLHGASGLGVVSCHAEHRRYDAARGCT